jgi:hypothetical protein
LCGEDERYSIPTGHPKQSAPKVHTRDSDLSALGNNVCEVQLQSKSFIYSSSTTHGQMEGKIVSPSPSQVSIQWWGRTNRPRLHRAGDLSQGIGGPHDLPKVS